MGYTTDFEGRFELDRKLDRNHAAYLLAFSESRRMKRDAKKAEKLPDVARRDAGLSIGVEGGYYVGDTDDQSVIDHNTEPSGQHSLWCDWAPTEDGKGIEWNESEKFHNYVDWLQYLIDHFLGPWGYRLNGEVVWHGERPSDVGKIIVRDNVVESKKGRIIYD